MTSNKKILLAMDESVESHRAVAYVADLLGGTSGIKVGLLHLESPPRMLEWGGSENPEIEERISAEREKDYRQLERETIAKGKAMLQGYQEILVGKGIDVPIQLVRFEEPLDRKTIAAGILKIALERGYGTVVVGRHLLSIWEKLFQHHVGKELLRIAEGITIWLVG